MHRFFSLLSCLQHDGIFNYIHASARQCIQMMIPSQLSSVFSARFSQLGFSELCRCRPSSSPTTSSTTTTTTTPTTTSTSWPAPWSLLAFSWQFFHLFFFFTLFVFSFSFFYFVSCFHPELLAKDVIWDFRSIYPLFCFFFKFGFHSFLHTRTPTHTHAPTSGLLFSVCANWPKSLPTAHARTHTNEKSFLTFGKWSLFLE